MKDYNLIEKEKNIYLYKKNDYKFLIFYTEEFNNKSNLINIIKEEKIFSLINQLNDDLILQFYKKDNKNLFYIFNLQGFDLINKICKIEFTYEIINKKKNVLSIIFNIIDDNDIMVEPNIIKNLQIDFEINNNKIISNSYINFKDNIEFFKRDILLLFFKKIIYRLKKYTSL